MDCEILRTLYVKANGGIPCHDDFGETIELGRLVADTSWSVKSFFESEKIIHIRDSLKAGKFPFDNCQRCAFMRPYREYRDHSRRLESIQIEPTLTCKLSCPGCTQAHQLAHRPPPHSLDLRAFETLLKSVERDGYSVDLMRYCGQGEPLNHPKFGKYVDLCRQILPLTRQELITNGNYDFAAKIGTRQMEQVVVSLDGATAESYPKYRRGGDFDIALKFLEAACMARPRIGRVTWKYVVLDTNDNDEELILAQKMADALQVDEIRFIQTHSRERSRRAEIPLVSQRATYIPTAIHAREEAEYKLIVDDAPIRRRFIGRGKRAFDRFKICIDSFKMTDNSFYCAGWALNGQSPVTKINMQTGQASFAARMGLPRPDVQLALDLDTDKVGFEVKGELPGAFHPRLDLSFAGEGRLMSHRFETAAERIFCESVELLPIWQVPDMNLPQRSST